MEESQAVIDRYEKALEDLGRRRDHLALVLREAGNEPDQAGRSRSAEHAAADRDMRIACHEWLQASDQYIGALPTIRRG
jgi:hypothetical protein